MAKHDQLTDEGYGVRIQNIVIYMSSDYIVWQTKVVYEFKLFSIP